MAVRARPYMSKYMGGPHKPKVCSDRGDFAYKAYAWNATAISNYMTHCFKFRNSCYDPKLKPSARLCGNDAL